LNYVIFYFRGFSNLKVLKITCPNSNKKANSATKCNSVLLEFGKEAKVCSLHDIFWYFQRKYLGFKYLPKKKNKKDTTHIFTLCLAKPREERREEKRKRKGKGE